MRPVRADSRMPNGAMSFMKESILVGFADLYFRSKLISSVFPSIALTRYMETCTSNCGKGREYRSTYTSTIQLFVLISRTFPPN